MIASRGPNQNRSDEKFIIFYWDTELEKQSQNSGGLVVERGGGMGEFVMMGLQKQKAGTGADRQCTANTGSVA